ncbi:hypothetical protein [Paucibacter soli]|uniref:hypothetical protein n=1 Tax=Paucibacter soli TaxID=3133433 RepID=UPI0030B56282
MRVIDTGRSLKVSGANSRGQRSPGIKEALLNFLNGLASLLRPKGSASKPNIALERLREVAVSTEVRKRAVPTPVSALRKLLEKHEDKRATMLDLCIVEATIRLAGGHNPLGHIRLETLTRALSQLSSICRINSNPEIAILELQMRRRVDELRNKEQVERAYKAAPILANVVTESEISADKKKSVLDLLNLDDSRYVKMEEPSFADTQPLDWLDVKVS